MSGLLSWFDMPDETVHTAIVLRSGGRYVGHVSEIRRDDEDGTVLIFSEGARRIMIDFAEVAAIETFGGAYSSPLVCEVCRKGNGLP